MHRLKTQTSVLACQNYVDCGPEPGELFRDRVLVDQRYLLGCGNVRVMRSVTKIFKTKIQALDVKLYL